MHELLLGVILLGAIFPVAVGLIDDHLGLLLTLIPVQVLLEVSQLLLGEEQSTHTHVSLVQAPGPEERVLLAPGSWCQGPGLVQVWKYTHAHVHAHTHAHVHAHTRSSAS